MANLRQQDNVIQADFFDLFGGLNITDSPFKVQNTQATDGYNFEYLATGGINKRNGHTILNSTPDTQLQSLGFGLWQSSTASITTKQTLRAAGYYLQEFNTSTGVTAITPSDTGATTLFTSSSPVVFSPFCTSALSLDWFAGGGRSGGLAGYYQDPNAGGRWTVNGMRTPGGSFTAAAGGADGTIPAGGYRYAVSLVKSQTQAESNASLDVLVTISANQHVTLTFSSLTDPNSNAASFNIYRSNISGVSEFTIGDLIATLTYPTTSYTDTGTVQGTQDPVPRAGNTLLDNSVLTTSNTYIPLTTFKRRLVTTAGSTVFLSDLDKPESWPVFNEIVIPTSGNITAVGIISFNTPTTSNTDEFLAVFKERELWMISGDALTGDAATGIMPWTLKFVDYVGCPTQPLLVNANGFLFWVDYRGAFLWDGSGKPIYISRLIEADFGELGDIDRSNLTLGCGAFYHKQNQVLWFLSSLAQGVQKLALKLDLRLTLPNVGAALAGRTLEGKFTRDTMTYPVYAAASTLPTYDEILYAGDNAGNILKLFNNLGSVDGSTAIQFRYRTRPEEFGFFGLTKRFLKVIVWCKETTIDQLTLNYWVSYRTDDAIKATQGSQIADRVTSGIWDQSYWDQSYWDQVLTTYVPVVFNLGNNTIGTEGDCLMLEFQQNDSAAPVTIGGFSVLFSTLGVRK